MRKWIMIVLALPALVASRPILISAQEPETLEKTAALVFSLTGSFLEATKEAQPWRADYHEVKYASMVSYMSTGFCLGVSFNKDKDVKKIGLRVIGLALINWVAWELRYAALDGSDDTYGGWPFKTAWMGTNGIVIWNILRTFVGVYLYATN